MHKISHREADSLEFAPWNESLVGSSNFTFGEPCGPDDSDPLQWERLHLRCERREFLQRLGFD